MNISIMINSFLIFDKFLVIFVFSFIVFKEEVILKRICWKVKFFVKFIRKVNKKMMLV